MSTQRLEIFHITREIVRIEIGIIGNQAFVKALGDLCGAVIIFLLTLNFYYGPPAQLYSPALFSSLWKDRISMSFICSRL